MINRIFVTVVTIGIFFGLPVNTPHADGTIGSDQKAKISSDAVANYQVGSGDILEISVWQEEDLVKEIVIPPDGVISFPLAGSLNVKGKTIDEINYLLTERLAKVIVDPIVTVFLKSYGSNKIFVLGKVTQPGEFPVVGPIYVMQALAMAGGMAKFADEENIQIIRNQNGNMISIPFNFSEVSKGRMLDQNIILQKGDVVVVP